MYSPTINKILTEHDLRNDQFKRFDADRSGIDLVDGEFGSYVWEFNLATGKGRAIDIRPPFSDFEIINSVLHEHESKS